MRNLCSRGESNSKSPRFSQRLVHRLCLSIGVFFICGFSSAQQVTTTVGAPKFWTCVTPPALPANAPGSAAAWLTSQAQICQEARLSGMHISATYTGPGGAIPAGKVAVSLIDAAGVVGKTTGASTDCGDQKRPFAFIFPVYFKTPAVEFHLEALCCEWTFKGTSESWIVFMPRPAGAQAIRQGEQAALAGTTAAQFDAVTTSIEDTVTSIWEYKYAYDGCNTDCGKVHCLDLTIYKASTTPQQDDVDVDVQAERSYEHGSQ